jgi:cell division septation protein DedD
MRKRARVFTLQGVRIPADRLARRESQMNQSSMLEENPMPTNEEGEFELVLGNRQLLSVFFIVVVLLGVFFTMGYILGRNTGPKVDIASSRPVKPIDVSSAKGDPPPAADPSKPSASGEPVAPPAQPEPTKPEPPKPEPAKTEAPSPKPAPVATAPKPDPPAPRPADPPKGGKGTYLQVSATTRKDAESLIGKLGGRGFNAITTPVPNSDLVRVLVGPIDDLADARGKLKAAGFADPIVRKL